MAQHIQVWKSNLTLFSSNITTGVSYVTTDKAGLEDITIVSPWPGDPHVSWKTPTRIAYSQENSKIINNKWGFEVTSKMKSYSWTKLLLDKNAAAMEHDDPSLTSLAGSGMLQLPPFRDAAGVCEDYLHEVYTHVSGILREQMTDLTFENTPMECWVTLPAVWSEEAKDATLKAARNAGFGKRSGDEIYTIAEPEAAAIATLKEYAKSDSFNPISVSLSTRTLEEDTNELSAMRIYLYVTVVEELSTLLRTRSFRCSHTLSSMNFVLASVSRLSPT